ncbi:MAG: flagellar hook protein FlgE [Bdellovibrionales bacterium]|nr:flagellar hook protein FlgE [Bdellovibrionales bacterium]
MAVLTSMYSSVTGLKAHGQALSIVADNVANASTNGFKSSRAEFQDLLSRSLKGAFGGNQIGRGAKLGAVNPILVQGNVDNTDRVTDLAINGNGYFVVDGYDGRAYTRNGELHFDKEGYLVTSDNYHLKGFEANPDGTITNKLEDIRLPSALVSAKPSKTVRMDINLDSRAPKGRVFNVNDPYNSSDFTTGVEVYDSQGAKHLITMAFNKVEDGVWEWRALANGSEVVNGGPGQYTQVGLGRLTFTPEGLLNTEEVLEKNFNFNNGALPGQDIVFDFGESITTDGGSGYKASKQYGSKSDLMSWSQDGAAAGRLTGLSFDDTGVLTAMYSNGTTKDMYQVAIAKFQSPEGLYKSGSNKMRESRMSGPPAIGKPAEGGRGQVFAKAIERSTTDIAKEFVNMIQYQRNFQANAKGISTADEMLADVINIKR